MSVISRFGGIPSLLRAKRKDWILLEMLPWLTLAGSLAITYQLWASARSDAEQALQTQFDYQVRNIVDDISKRMRTYEQVMRGVDGFFSHARAFKRDEFHDYVASLKLRESYPGIQGIRFVPVVRKGETARHVATIRKQGLSTYTIWPKGERDAYAPVSYVEPFDLRNQRVFGYDMLSDREYPLPGESGGVRRAAMEQARDTGSVTLSSKANLLFETEHDRQHGFVMLLPVYRHGSSRETVAERRANIIGWICSTFRANDLMDGILGEHGSKIDIEIFDGEEVSPGTLMYDSHPSLLHQHSRFRTTRQLRIAGRVWTVAAHSLIDFEQLMDTEKPGIIAWYGISTSLFLASFVWLLVFGRKRAVQASRTIEQKIVERHQAEQSLREVEARFRYIFDYSKVGICLVGPDYRYVRINRAFCEMTGYSEEDLLAHDFKGITHLDSIEPNLTLSKKLLAGEIDYFNIQKKYVCKNGSILHGDLTVSAMREENGKLLFGIGMVQNITDRVHIEQQLRNLTAYLQSVREEEKANIAREIHDDLGSMLTSLKIEAYWLKDELSANNRDKTMLLNHVRAMAEIIDNASGVTRNIITGLRPAVLDDLGLLAALEWQAVHFQKRTGIKSRVNCIGDKGDLDKTRSIELFRISQEALSNVAKHSGATSIEIEFHHSDEEVVMSIIDNGRGISGAHADNAKHYGILGMRERTDQLGGTITFDTPPGGGFSLTVILPLPLGQGG